MSAPPHRNPTGIFHPSPRTEAELSRYTYQRRVEGVPILLHTPRLPKAGDIGYFVNGHVLLVDSLRFVPPRCTSITRETVLDMFAFVDRWHKTASESTPTVVANSLTTKEMIFVSNYRALPQAASAPPDPHPTASKPRVGPGVPQVTQGLIHYHKIRRRWLPGRCNTTCDSIFPTRSLLFEDKDPQYETQVRRA